MHLNYNIKRNNRLLVGNMIVDLKRIVDAGQKRINIKNNVELVY